MGTQVDLQRIVFLLSQIGGNGGEGKLDLFTGKGLDNAHVHLLIESPKCPYIGGMVPVADRYG